MSSVSTRTTLTALLSPWSKAVAASLLVTGVLTAQLACEREPTELEKLGVTEKEARDILKKIERERVARDRAKQKPTASPPPAAPDDTASPAPVSSSTSSSPSRGDAGSVQTQFTDPALTTDRWIVDGLSDVAPAGPSTAHRRGVYLVTDDNQLRLAKLGTLSRSQQPSETPIQPLPDDTEHFQVLRGPSFSATHAYWISGHTLYRAPLATPGRGHEPLAQDARIATRTSALTVPAKPKPRDWVAYIALPEIPDGPLRAKLWYGGTASLVLTPPSASALNVQLVSTGKLVSAYSLEGRTGMTAVHVRQLLPGEDAPTLTKDEAVWLGGGSTPTTELRIGKRSDHDVFGLLPIERDALHFGMAVIALSGARSDAPASNQWLNYPNGMSYAPTDSTSLCGRVVVLFTRPSTSVPHSPQELVLAELEHGLPKHELILSRSKAFFDVSIAEVAGGALLTYVADYRTWARTLRCKR